MARSPRARRRRGVGRGGTRRPLRCRRAKEARFIAPPKMSGEVRTGTNRKMPGGRTGSTVSTTHARSFAKVADIAWQQYIALCLGDYFLCKGVAWMATITLGNSAPPDPPRLRRASFSISGGSAPIPPLDKLPKFGYSVCTNCCSDVHIAQSNVHAVSKRGNRRNAQNNVPAVSKLATGVCSEHVFRKLRRGEHLRCVASPQPPEQAMFMPNVKV
jgi:hypothetical protein